MGVIPVNENEKGFNFDGESSKTFDLFITGGAIFDAPERDVEMIEIPGRNGALVQDLGRFKNVTVTYNCALTSTKEHEFVDAMRKVREWLCSKRGYCRLWDDFNPGEYRLGMFKGYIEVTNEAPVVGRFDLSFDCMPQRFLLNGDNPVAVSDGGSIFNPTMFDAKPLLQVHGYGDIGIGDYNLRIYNVQIGMINVSNPITRNNQDLNRTFNINEAQYEPGDHVIIDAITVNTTFKITNNATYRDFQSPDRTMGIEYYNTVDSDATLSYNKSGKTASFGINIPAVELTIGQNLTKTYRVRATINLQRDLGDVVKWQSSRVYVEYIIRYTSGVLEISAETLLFNTDRSLSLGNPTETCLIRLGSITGNSTKSLNGTLYFDLDIGEAYAIEGGQIISANNIVEIPAELPVLKPGANAIAFDNTIDELNIVPRWWEV